MKLKENPLYLNFFIASLTITIGQIWSSMCQFHVHCENWYFSILLVETYINSRTLIDLSITYWKVHGAQEGGGGWIGLL